MSFLLFAMLAAIDIGNSAIKIGLFDGSFLVSKVFIPARHDRSAEAAAREIDSRLKGQVESAIVSSVVPELDQAVAHYLENVRNIPTRFVRPTDDFGLTIDFPVDSFGADRLVNCFAASRKFGVPCVVVSLGTATTIDVVNSKRKYLGGLIAAGMNVSAKALAIAASKLPEVELSKPDNVIARSTETAIRSGIVFGQISMVEGLLLRAVAELGETPNVIATGGFAPMIAGEIETIDVIDPDLTLDGLRFAADKA